MWVFQKLINFQISFLFPRNIFADSTFISASSRIGSSPASSSDLVPTLASVGWCQGGRQGHLKIMSSQQLCSSSEILRRESFRTFTFSRTASGTKLRGFWNRARVMMMIIGQMVLRTNDVGDGKRKILQIWSLHWLLLLTVMTMKIISDGCFHISHCLLYIAYFTLLIWGLCCIWSIGHDDDQSFRELWCQTSKWKTNVLKMADSIMLSPK